MLLNRLIRSSPTWSVKRIGKCDNDTGLDGSVNSDGVFWYVGQKKTQDVTLVQAHRSQQGVGEAPAEGTRLAVGIRVSARPTRLLKNGNSVVSAEAVQWCVEG